MAKHQPHGHARHPISFHHPSDHESCVPPERGSHMQGNHAGEYTRKHGLGNPMRERDRAKVHSSEKM